MTPDDLRAWQAHMGLSQRAAAQALGVTHAAYGAWVLGRTPIRRIAALACAALAAGLPPLKLNMTAADLRAWQIKIGLAQRAAATALGVTHATYSTWVRGVVNIDLRTALACAALAAGLEPWSKTTGDTN